MQEISDFQAVVWRHERDLHAMTAKVQARIEAGARVVSKRFTWDSKLRMVRTVKSEVIGG